MPQNNNQADGEGDAKDTIGALTNHVDAESVARLLGVSISKVYRLARQGRFDDLLKCKSTWDRGCVPMVRNSAGQGCLAVHSQSNHDKAHQACWW